MSKIFTLFVICTLAGCTNSAGIDESTQSRQLMTFECDQDWSKCVRQASKACGPRGFEEINRFSDKDMTSAGRMIITQNGNEGYREDARLEEKNRVLAIRCN